MSYYRENIRKQLISGSVWVEPNDEENIQGLERRLDNYPEDRTLIIEACKELLFDSDVGVRSGIVAILSY